MAKDDVNVRKVSLGITASVMEGGKFLNEALSNALEKYQSIDKKRRNYISYLTRGTIERIYELDAVISSYSSTPIRKLNPNIRNILRLAVYELRYMDSVPESATCNEYVKLAGKTAPSRLKGFVNGVLRSMIRDNFSSVKLEDYEKYSLPKWLYDELKSEYENIDGIAKALLKSSSITIRTNLTKCTPKELKSTLEDEGVNVEPVDMLDYAFSVGNIDYIKSLESFKKGLFYVQGISSMMVGELSDVEAGDTVIDVCASPGGKSLHIAELIKIAEKNAENEISKRDQTLSKKSGEVLAFDISEKKVDRIRENIKRTGLDNISAAVYDASKYNEELEERGDIVIADVPCSGVGVLKKKPDIKVRLNKDDIDSLSEIQYKILDNVKRYVKPNGKLIYSTCTILNKENEANIKKFLEENQGFSLEKEKKYLPSDLNDGFYIAVLRKQRPDIKSFDMTGLTDYMETLGEKKFRAKQLYEWMHVHLARSYDEMTNISKKLRDTLKNSTNYVSLEIEDVQISKEDGTRKYLFKLSDGNMIESVFMRYKHGISVCISSQVGCKMGCNFCASTIDGFVRNLTPSEMLDQIYAISKDTGERVSNVVVMGTGEPLDNYDNLIRFIRMLTDENGLNISERNVTVSTCGLVPRIYDLAKEDLNITLALSLHASNQKKREEIMPVSKKYDISEAVNAMKDYFNNTGRRITYEYTLIRGVNDKAEDAEELSSLIKGSPCHVNLIPVNPVSERSYSASNSDAVLSFKKKLEKNAINVTIRREMGRDIDGACGQLRRKHINSIKTSTKEGLS